MKTALEFCYRNPQPGDLDALLEIEQQVFSTDRISRRRMRHWISADKRSFIVCTTNTPPNTVVGYILFFYRQNTDTARLYSIAVSEKFRGHGIARQLMARGERDIQQRGRHGVQLEVRPDNTAAITLYQSLGYQPFGSYPAFYEDGQDALRFRKRFS